MAAAARRAAALAVAALQLCALARGAQGNVAECIRDLCDANAPASATVCATARPWVRYQSACHALCSQVPSSRTCVDTTTKEPATDDGSPESCIAVHCDSSGGEVVCDANKPWVRYPSGCHALCRNVFETVPEAGCVATSTTVTTQTTVTATTTTTTQTTSTGLCNGRADSDRCLTSLQQFCGQTSKFAQEVRNTCPVMCNTCTTSTTTTKTTTVTTVTSTTVTSTTVTSSTITGTSTSTSTSSSSSRGPGRNCARDEYESSTFSASTDRVCTKLTSCASAASQCEQTPQGLRCATYQQYETTKPTTTTDRVCAPVSVCGDHMVELARPTAVSNRQCQCASDYHDPDARKDPGRTSAAAASTPSRCAACATCSRGHPLGGVFVPAEYQTAPCTPMSNRVCTIQPVCNEAVEYETKAPTFGSPRECTKLQVCYPPATFAKTAPTPTSDRQCQTTRTCGRAERELAPPTATSDRTCVQCDGVAEFQDADAHDNAAACKRVRECGEGEYEARGPTPSSDRVCVACQRCFDPWFEATACSSARKADRTCQRCKKGEFRTVGPSGAVTGCQAHSTCAAGEFEAQVGTDYKDTVCRPWSRCLPGTYEHTAPSDYSDRECVPCADGATFTDTTNARACAPCSKASTCAAGFYMLGPCRKDEDNQCVLCPHGTYRNHAGNSNSNSNSTACLPWRQSCAAGMEEAASPTAAVDRRCAPCPQGMFRRAGAKQLHCQPWSACPIGFVGSPGTASTDTVCAASTTTATTTTTTTTAATLAPTTTTIPAPANASSATAAPVAENAANASLEDNYVWIVMLAVVVVFLLFLAVVLITRRTTAAHKTGSAPISLSSYPTHKPQKQQKPHPRAKQNYVDAV